MARVRIRVPDAHGEKQRQIMEAFLGVNPDLREAWVACGSKFGKTMSAAGALCVAAPLRPQTLWRWIGPIYTQSRIGYNYMRRMLPKVGVDNKDSDPSITFPSLDTKIQFFHGQHPESIEGEATAGNVIDEASKQKEQVYVSTKTTTIQTGGIILPISTPRGKGNWFYKGCMRAKEEMARAAFEGRRPRSIYIHAPTYANPFVPQSSIDEMKRTMPARLFQQYVEAEFLDDGSVFMYLSEAFGRPLDYENLEVWFKPNSDSKRAYIGADWAKQEDSTVFTALNERGELIGFQRFNRVAYPEQVARLYQFVRTLKGHSGHAEGDAFYAVAEHDQTGVGEAVNDIIVATNPGFDIVGIRWTNPLKEAYVSDLMVSCEERTTLKLHPIQVLRDEMDQFEVSVSISGRAVYSAPDGQHDDCVMSLVIANRLFRQNRGSIANIVVVDVLANMVRKIYYNGGVLED